MWWGGRTITFIILSCIVKALLGGGQDCLLAKGKKLHPSVLLKKTMAFSLCGDADSIIPVLETLEAMCWRPHNGHDNSWLCLKNLAEATIHIYTWFVKKVTAVPVSNHLEIDKRILNYMCANWVFIRVTCIPWCRHGRTWCLCYNDKSISDVKQTSSFSSHLWNTVNIKFFYVFFFKKHLRWALFKMPTWNFPPTGRGS